MIRNIAGRMQFNFAIEKKLFVYDSGSRDGTMDNSLPNLHSGIRATIFGASGKAIKYSRSHGQVSRSTTRHGQ